MAERLRGRAGVEQRRRRLAAEPLCRMCREQGRTTAATVPDHIVALVNGGADDDSNVQCLCDEHHQAKTRADLGHRPLVPIDADGWPTTT